METKKMHVGAGDWLGSAVKKAIQKATDENCQVEFDFNEVIITAKADSDPAALEKYYHEELDRNYQNYIASPEYKKAQVEAAKKQEEQDNKRAAWLKESPAEMSLVKPEEWAESVAKNNDPYGSGVMRFAEKWARLMEGQINKGKKLADVASECSHLADDEGITGFMYGCAVSILSQVWTHGEKLRQWHNKDYGAEDIEGVANPAILTIG